MDPLLDKWERAVFKPFPIKYSFLLKQKFTYNLLRNKYAISGLIYGSLVAFFIYYFITVSVYNSLTADFGIFFIVFYYFLLFQPVIGWLSLGTVGTLLKIKKEYYFESYHKLREIADTDSLTGLFNNRYFKIRAQERFHLAKRHDKEFCIVMFDIDDFKKVNDTYGHPEGDRILGSVAAVLKKHSRTADIPVRYGGEEFLLFLSNTSPDIGSIISERVRAAIDDQIFVISDNPMNITVSGGLSSFPEDGGQITELIKVADSRLYKAKKMGKNRIVNADGEYIDKRR